MAELVARYAVTNLTILKGWDERSLEFLDDLPDLKRLHVSVKGGVDWAPLERHGKLEWISLNPQMPWCPSSRVPQGALDFSSVKSLTVCNIPAIPEWDSIRQCSRLENLRLHNSGEVRELDLSRLNRLSELALEAFAELRRVVIPAEAKIRALKISGTPKLKIDLQRLVRDVEYLWIGGNCDFGLEALAEARHVKRLSLTQLGRKAAQIPFLAAMTELEDLDTLGSRLHPADEPIAEAQFAKQRELMQKFQREAAGREERAHRAD
jgi:hypothetical protein